MRVVRFGRVVSGDRGEGPHVANLAVVLTDDFDQCGQVVFARLAVATHRLMLRKHAMVARQLVALGRKGALRNLLLGGGAAVHRPGVLDHRIALSRIGNHIEQFAVRANGVMLERFVRQRSRSGDLPRSCHV